MRMTQIAPPTVTLSPEDMEEIDKLESLRDLIRDRVTGVAERYHVGTYIYGRPGSSKTHTVVETLDNLGNPYKLCNARMSAPGLFDVLRDHPEHVVVLDDINSLFKNKGAIQILMAALGGKPGEPRRITYQIKGIGKESCDFSGGIVAISNLPLRRDPETDALTSRVTTLSYEPTDAMLIAFCKSLALKGFEDLTPVEAIDVVEFVLSECRKMDVRIDLRTVVKAWHDRRLDKNGISIRPWEDLVRSSLDRPTVRTESRADRIERETILAKELFLKFPEDKATRDKVWRDLTQSSPHSLYRRYRGE